MAQSFRSFNPRSIGWNHGRTGGSGSLWWEQRELPMLMDFLLLILLFSLGPATFMTDLSSLVDHVEKHSYTHAEVCFTIYILCVPQCGHIVNQDSILQPYEKKCSEPLSASTACNLKRTQSVTCARQLFSCASGVMLMVLCFSWMIHYPVG